MASNKKVMLKDSPGLGLNLQQRSEKKVFLPLRINLAEYNDSFGDSSSVRKTKKVKVSKSGATPNISKKVFQPIRFNPADWDDSPISVKLKKTTTNAAAGKNVLMKANVLTRMTSYVGNYNGTAVASFAKPKSNTTNTYNGVRKELFSGNRNKVHKNSITQAYRRSTAGKKRTESCLDNTEPLMDINEAEAELFQKSVVSARVIQNNVGLKRFNFNQNLPHTSTSQSEFRVPNGTATNKQCISKIARCKAEFNNYLPDNLTGDGSAYSMLRNISYHLRNKSTGSSITSMSPSMNEFIKNEKICEVYTKKPVSISNGEFTHECDALNNIQMVLENEHQSFRKLQNRFENICHTFVEFQKEFELFQEVYIQNKIQIGSSGNENLSSTGKIKNELPQMPLSENVMSSHKKSTRKVAFNLNSSSEKAVENFTSDDIVLKKSVYSYNSLHKEFKSILSTPKSDRFCVPTPKSLRNKEKDLISTSIQKQLLLLNDTPCKKRKT